MNVCLDFLLNLLYNGKRILCKFFASPLFVRRAWTIALSWLLLLAQIPVSASDGGEDELALSLRTEVCEEGRVGIALVKSGGAFCGLLLEVGYPDTLSLGEVEKGDLLGEAELTWICRDGLVRLLLDGKENLTADGVLAVLWFSLSDMGAPAFAFSLSCADGAVLSREGDALLPVTAVACGTVCGRMPKDGGEVLLLATAESGSLRLSVMAPACFASGVKICLADMKTGELTEYIMAGAVASGRAFVTEIEIPRDGCVCVLVQPVGYRRADTLYGDVRVYCFVNGAFMG